MLAHLHRDLLGFRPMLDGALNLTRFLRFFWLFSQVQDEPIGVGEEAKLGLVLGADCSKCFSFIALQEECPLTQIK